MLRESRLKFNQKFYQTRELFISSFCTFERISLNQLMNQQNPVLSSISKLLTPSQNIRIHQELKNHDLLKQKKNQLQLNLIHLKQAAKVFQKLINAIKSHPSYPKNNQTMKISGENLINSINKLRDATEAFSRLKAQKIQYLYRTSKSQFESIDIEVQSKMNKVWQSQVQAKINFCQNKIAQMSQKIKQIEKQLQDCKIDSELNQQDRVNEVIAQILNIYPDSISLKEIELLKNFNFDAFKMEILSSTSEYRNYLREQSRSILNLRNQISFRQQFVNDINILESQLQSNRELEASNKAKIVELTDLNNRLEENFATEVQKEVNQRKKMLNDSHLRQTGKYLRGAEYLLKIFQNLIEEEKFKELIGKISEIQGEAAEKSLIDNREDPQDLKI